MPTLERLPRELSSTAGQCIEQGEHHGLASTLWHIATVPGYHLGFRCVTRLQLCSVIMKLEAFPFPSLFSTHSGTGWHLTPYYASKNYLAPYAEKIVKNI